MTEPTTPPEPTAASDRPLEVLDDGSPNGKKILAVAGVVVFLAAVGVVVGTWVLTQNGARELRRAALTTTTTAATVTSTTTTVGPRGSFPIGGNSITPPPTTAAATASTCTNPVHGWTIEYPASWYTATAASEWTCAAFGPTPITIEPNTEVVAPIVVAATPDANAELDSYRDTAMYELLSTASVPAAGVDATRLELRATGDGLDEAGTQLVVYVVPRADESAVVIIGRGTTNAEYATVKPVTDAIAASITL